MANLLAVFDPDEGFIAGLEQALRDSGDFDSVWRPAPGWIAGQAMLPESEPDSEELRSRGLIFAQGRDRVESGTDLAWADRVAELADRSPDRLSELPGDFTFLRFRGDGSVLAVTSCAGAAPLYVERRSHRIALSTMHRYFPRFLPGPYTADPLMTSCWESCLHFIDGRTFLEGVEALPPGSYCELSGGHAPQVGPYWDPRQEEVALDPEHARELRRLLIETLDRDLDPKGRNLASLSGGPDSSCVAALAAGTLGRGLSTWSLIPPVDPGRAHELSFIEPLVSELGIRQARLVEAAFSVQERWNREAPALPFPVGHPVLCELPRVCKQQEVVVLTGGEFADEVGGHWGRFGDWCRFMSLPKLIRHPGAELPFGRRDYLVWAKRRFLDRINRPRLMSNSYLPAWVRPEIEAEYREWLRRRTQALSHDRRPLKDLAERASARAWVAMNWEATSSLGVRRSLPFFNREVLELAFRCDPRELLGPGPKKLLRSSVRRDVPEKNLDRADKGSRIATWPETSPSPMPAVGEGEVPRGASLVAPTDWLPSAPAGASYSDVLRLRSALRVVGYLEALG